MITKAVVLVCYWLWLEHKPSLNETSAAAIHGLRRLDFNPRLPIPICFCLSATACVGCLQRVGLALQVLSNGVECRLQRNALAVLEPPTGNETVSRVSIAIDLNWLQVLPACVYPELHMPRSGKTS